MVESAVVDQEAQAVARAHSRAAPAKDAIERAAGDEPGPADQLDDILCGFRTGHGDLLRVGEVPHAFRIGHVARPGK